MKRSLVVALLLISSTSWAAPKKKAKRPAAPTPTPALAPEPSPSPSAPVETGAGSAAGAASAVTSTSTPASTPPNADVAPEPAPPTDTPRTLSFSASGGMVVLGQSFHSNGELRAGRLDDYQYTSEGVAARADARATFPIGRVFHVGLGGFYQYAGATGTRATAYDANGVPSSVKLSLESHAAAVTLTPGVHVGGVDVDLAAGPIILVNYIGIDARAPLPSDRTIGLFTGVHVDAPALLHAANRPLGLTVDGGFVEIAQHDQTENLQDGESATSRALMGGVEVAYGLFPESSSTQLAVVLGYHGGLQTSRYAGTSVRNGPTNGNATSAERVQETHVSSLGLRLAH